MSGGAPISVGDHCPYCVGGIITQFRYDANAFECNTPWGTMLLVAWHKLPPSPAVTAGPDPHYPHVCPKCSGPAYQGVTPGSKVDCKKGCGV